MGGAGRAPGFYERLSGAHEAAQREGGTVERERERGRKEEETDCVFRCRACGEALQFSLFCISSRENFSLCTVPGFYEI